LLDILRKNWFLCWLIVLIMVGLRMGGAFTSADMLNYLDGQHSALGPVWRLLPRIVTAVILFLMSFSLDTRRFAASLRSPAPVVWGSIVNFALLPLMAWPLMQVQITADLAIGLMIAAAVPCTMAAASVWTRAAGGNDAVSLMITLATNSLCFIITPFWLQIAVGQYLAVNTNAIRLDATAMALRLVTAVLLPTILGQVLRLSSSLAEFAARQKPLLSNLAQCCILVLVFNGAWQGGAQLYQQEQGPAIGGIVLVWISCLALHSVAMVVAKQGGKLLGFAREDQVALYFAGSQKTLPIGIYLATDSAMFGKPDFLGPEQGLPFVVFPMLLYHTTQLFMDTFVASAIRQKHSESEL